MTPALIDASVWGQPLTLNATRPPSSNSDHDPTIELSKGELRTRMKETDYNTHCLITLLLSESEAVDSV